MKTLKELRENLDAKGVGLETGIMPPGSVRKVRTIARQVSNASQPNIPQVITRIDEELRKYGYTLGEVDMSDDFPETGKDDFAIFAYPTLDAVRNVYITVSWEKTNAMLYKYSPDVLQYSVRVLVNITDPTDFDDMVGDGLYDEGQASEVVEESTKEDKEPVKEEVAEQVEDLEEAVKLQVRGKVFRATQGSKDSLSVVKDGVSLSFAGQIDVRGKDKETFIEKLTEFLLDV